MNQMLHIIMSILFVITFFYLKMFVSIQYNYQPMTFFYVNLCFFTFSTPVLFYYYIDYVTNMDNVPILFDSSGYNLS